MKWTNSLKDTNYKTDSRKILENKNIPVSIKWIEPQIKKQPREKTSGQMFIGEFNKHLRNK